MKYAIGTLVLAKLGTAPLPGVVVYQDTKNNRYLIRFNGTQQAYYTASELAPYPTK